MVFYDLRVPDVLREQAKLAKNYGIYGFNFYYYWFDSKTLMNKPFEILLEHKDIDINFCITWANENWTRRWDGAENDILMAQNHSDEDSIKFIENLYKFFEDSRYIRVNNKPVLIIYRADIIPNMKSTVELWRKKVLERGFDGIYLICAQTFGIKSPDDFGFDAAMEFPPHTIETYDTSHDSLEVINPNFKGKVHDYIESVENMLQKVEPQYKLFKTSTLSWDNTARKQNDGTVFHNFSLELYKKWMFELYTQTLNNKKYNSDEKLVFVNAWNEWAEGTHLEPDRKYGYGYLQATYNALAEANYKKKSDQKVDIIIIAGQNDTLLQSLVWFYKKTFLDIELICFGEESYFSKYRKYYDITCYKSVEDVDIRRLLKENYNAVKSIYVHTQDFDKEFFKNIEQTYIPIVKISDFEAENCNFELKLLEILYKKTNLKPRVSIIVPCYNHAEFLGK